MYKQEKKYVILAKDGKKLADAGLYKLSVSESKIRVEYFLNALPIHYDTDAECVLQFRLKEETSRIKKWKKTLSRANSHYVFSTPVQKEVVEICECFLRLQGNLMIAEDETISMKETKQTEQTIECEKKKEVQNLQYIRDLERLKEGNEVLRELYYNRFLLHGYYQYRYVVLGKNFIGVPDHFYEREAIAARMMGFPYFVEAEFIENCEIGEQTRSELPKQGSFGYYLRKLVSTDPVSLHLAETRTES